MKTAYKVLAYVVAAEVAIQAMLVAWALAGLGKWVEAGGVFDKSVIEGQGTPFPEVLGVPLHGLNGGIIVPIIALALLVLSFFTRLQGASKWGAAVFVLVVLQGQLGFLGHELPLMGAVHGLNALLVFAAALYTARRVRTAAAILPKPAERAASRV